jgi:hypothetical protein
MLVRYFRRPSRIEQLRSSTGGHLLEGFAKEMSQGRSQRKPTAHRVSSNRKLVTSPVLDS